MRLGDRHRSRAHGDLAGSLAKRSGHGKAARPADGAAALCVFREIKGSGHIQCAAVHGQAAGAEIIEVDRTGDAGIENNIVSRRNDDVRDVGEIRNRATGPVGGIRPITPGRRPDPDHGSELSNGSREAGRLRQCVVERSSTSQGISRRHGNAGTDIRRSEIPRLGQRHRVARHYAAQTSQRQRGRGRAVIHLAAHRGAEHRQRRLRNADVGQARLGQHVVAGQARAADQRDARGHCLATRIRARESAAQIAQCQSFAVLQPRQHSRSRQCIERVRVIRTARA